MSDPPQETCGWDLTDPRDQKDPTRAPPCGRSLDHLWGMSGSPTSELKSDHLSESCSNALLPPSWLDWALQ